MDINSEGTIIIPKHASQVITTSQRGFGGPFAIQYHSVVKSRVPG